MSHAPQAADRFTFPIFEELVQFLGLAEGSLRSKIEEDERLSQAQRTVPIGFGRRALVLESPEILAERARGLEHEKRLRDQADAIEALLQRERMLRGIAPPDAARVEPRPRATAPGAGTILGEVLRARPVQAGAKVLPALLQAGLPEPLRSARFRLPGLSDVPKTSQERLAFEVELARRELEGQAREQSLRARQGARSLPPILTP